MFSRVWKLLLPVALACSLYYASEVDFARERSLDGKPLAVSINQTPGTYIVVRISINRRSISSSPAMWWVAGRYFGKVVTHQQTLRAHCS
jgi:hypothetical protein